jgi:hypothetical protein
MLAIIVASTASAQSVFDEDFGRVIDPASSPVTANGIGAPTVAWDPNDETFVMFFETRVGAATPQCPAGTWGIGAASSADGVNWDIWDQLVVTPTAGTPYACVAAHPATVWEGGVFHLWFKAEQGTGATEQGWGTNNYSGVGYGTIDLSLDDKSADIAAIDAEMQALEDIVDQAVLDLDTTLTQLEASILAQSDEFECVPTAPICAPCNDVFLAGIQSGAGTVTNRRDFCQPFAFVLPTNLNATGLTVPGDQIRLEWDEAGGGNHFCRERLIGGIQTMTCNGGDIPGTTVVTADSYVELQVRSSGNWVVVGSANLSASNAQTTTGDVLDGITALQAFTSIPDDAGVFPLVPAFRADLLDLINWLNLAPVTPDETLLRAELVAARAEARDVRQLISTTNTQLAALQAERDDLVAYTQYVSPSIQSNGVALQLNQVFGYPSVAKIGNEWVMVLQQYPNLYRASGASPDAFTLDADSIIDAGAVSWANTEVFEPSLYCAVTDPSFPYRTWLAGRAIVAGTLSTAGASDAISSDGLTWLLNTTADFLWGDINDYRHFDVVSDASGSLRMYWVKRVGGVNEVHLQATDPTWIATDTLNRDCP